MKREKLVTLGLSFVLAVGCCWATGAQKMQAQSVEADSGNTYVYSVENLTRGTVYEIDFVNDYFGYSAPYQQSAISSGSSYAIKKGASYRYVVAYTYDACYDETTQKAEVTVDNIYFKGQDQYMTVSPDKTTGDYTVDSITKITDTTVASYTFTIPEDGYVILTSAKSTGLTEAFSEGDVVSGIINQHQYELKNISSDCEYSLRLTTKSNNSFPDATFAGNDASLLTPATDLTVTTYASRSYIVAEKETNNTYKITNVYMAGSSTTAPSSITLDKDTILIGLGAIYRANINYQKGGFVSACKVGDILSLTDHSAERSFVGASLTLSGAIGMNFKLALGVNSNSKKIVFKQGEIEIETIQVSDLTAVDSVKFNNSVYKNYYKVTCPVLAKDYNKSITVEVQNSVGAVGISKTYSIADYAQVIANGNYAKELKDATVALVNYCEAACNYANNVAVTAEQLELNLSQYAPIQSGTSTISNVSVKLVLDSDTELRVYFTTEELPVCMVDGETQTPVSVGNNRYYVSYKDIGAHELANAINFRFGDYTIECSAMSYAYIVLSNNAFITSQPALYNAMGAMYNYYVKVSEYVQSLEG